MRSDFEKKMDSHIAKADFRSDEEKRLQSMEVRIARLERIIDKLTGKKDTPILPEDQTKWLYDNTGKYCTGFPNNQIDQSQTEDKENE